MKNNDEVRKAGEYKITHSVHIGNKELVMGENLNDKDGHFYLLGECTKNVLFEQFENCLVGNDFLELAEIFSQRLEHQVQELKNERGKTHSDEMITKDMCCPDSQQVNYKDKVIVIKPSALRPEYRNTVHQLYRATSGNGIKPNGMGAAVFCTNLYTGKRTRFERYDIAGIIKPELFPAWAKERLNFVKEFENTPHSFEYNGKHFVSIGRLPVNFDFNNFSENMKSDFELGLSKYGWAKHKYSPEDFHKASRGPNDDIYKCFENGKNYIPGENELFEYTGKVQQKEKAKNHKELER